MTLNYRLQMEPDDNGTTLVTSPDFPVVTYGEDEAAAASHAVDAIETLLASMMAAGEPIPPGYQGTDHARPLARLPLLTDLKVTLYTSLRDAGLTRADLQRKLGWQRESIDRLFRLDHGSKVEQIDEAFRALGKSVSVHVADASDEAA